MSDFDEQAEKAIPADVRMISGCRDEQTSADVGNVSTFQLPDPAGRAGGACTSALLKVLYEEKQAPPEDISFIDTFLRMRDVLSNKGFSQVPQLSSSRRLDVNQNFSLTSGSGSGKRRAVLIGINYVGQQGELSGCHNDVHNIKEYLMDVHGFSESGMKVLMDDGDHLPPTKRNIMGALKDLVEQCEDGDTAFVHYSGHGGKTRDTSGDEDDGFDETLIPVDFMSAGQIVDDDLYEHLVCAMPRGVTLTCLMDCCHSGTVLDLPYNFVADGEQEEMQEVEGFDFGKLVSWLHKNMQKSGIHNVMDLRDKEKLRGLGKNLMDDELGGLKSKFFG